MRLLRSHRFSRPGAFLALWAIVALTLLAPVHAVHALQRASAAGPVGCHDAPHDGAADHARHDSATQYCPVCALAKAAGGLVTPTVPALAGLTVTAGLRLAPADAIGPDSRRRDPGQARGPPASA
jgi:hypothetical protein